MIEDFKRSGLDINDIKKYGIKEIAVGYEIPFFDPKTKQPMKTKKGIDYVRTRLKNPIDGAKYLSPKEGGVHCFITQETHKFLIEHPKEPVIITEGEKKAIRGIKAGIPVIGIPGITAWVDGKISRYPTDKINKDLVPYLLPGRKVILIFDSDAKHPRKADNFTNSANDFAKELEKYKIKLIRVDLPQIEGKTIGLDDYLEMSKTKEDLFKYIEAQGIVDPHLPKFEFINGKALAEKEIPPCNWFLNGIMPEGFNLLTAPSKKGKSILALQLAHSVAHGIPALQSIQTQKCNVAYFCLEDSDRQVQSRYNKLNLPLPENMMFTFDLPTSDRSTCIKAMDQFLEEHEVKFVVIDTIGRLRPSGKRQGGTLYDEDTDFYGAFRSMAHKHNACILALHHTNKGLKSNDPFDKISGSMGVMGATDTAMMFESDPNGDGFDRILHIRGKDVEEQSLALKSIDNYQWEMIGNAIQLAKTQAQKEIFEVLRQSKTAMKVKEIQNKIGKTQSATSKLLKTMKQEGLIISPEYGKYWTNPYNNQLTNNISNSSHTN